MAKVQKRLEAFDKVRSKRKKKHDIEMEIKAVRLRYSPLIKRLEEKDEISQRIRVLESQLDRWNRQNTEEAKREAKRIARLLKDKKSLLAKPDPKPLSPDRVAIKLFPNQTIGERKKSREKVKKWIRDFRKRYIKFRKAGPTDLELFYRLKAVSLKARFGIEYNTEDGKLIQVLEQEWILKPAS
jgi:hypothetical protein